MRFRDVHVGQSDPAVSQLKKQAKLTESSELYTPELELYVRGWQRQAGLLASGVIDQALLQARHVSF